MATLLPGRGQESITCGPEAMTEAGDDGGGCHTRTVVVGAGVVAVPRSHPLAEIMLLSCCRGLPKGASVEPRSNKTH